MKIPLLIILAWFSTQLWAASADWQGEWGSYRPTQPTPTGGNLSISACDEQKGTCVISFQSGRPTGTVRCQAGTSRYPQTLKITNGGSARADLTGYNKQGVDCHLNLKLRSGDKPQIHAALEGNNCKYFCTRQAFIVETYALRTRANYPEGLSSECYLDDRAPRRALCETPALQAKYDQIQKLQDEVEALTKGAQYVKYREAFEQLLTSCVQDSDASGCMDRALTARIAQLHTEKQSATVAKDKRDTDAATPGDPKIASKWIDDLSGVYKRRFKSGLIDGTKYNAENILEMVRVSDDTLYFKTHLDFFNGHMCSLHGLARYKANGNFVFVSKDPDAPDYCSLQIQPGEKVVRFLDGQPSCSRFWCGARGGFTGIEFSRTQRRDIRYMSRLKASEDYKEAVSGVN